MLHGYFLVTNTLYSCKCQHTHTSMIRVHHNYIHYMFIKTQYDLSKERNSWWLVILFPNSNMSPHAPNGYGHRQVIVGTFYTQLTMWTSRSPPKKRSDYMLKVFFVNILVDSIVNIINGWVGVKKRKILHFDNTKRLAWTRAHDLQITLTSFLEVCSCPPFLEHLGMTGHQHHHHHHGIHWIVDTHYYELLKLSWRKWWWSRFGSLPILHQIACFVG
jgi:hypothetical protein